MADQDGRHSEMITQLLRHLTSSPHDAEAKGAHFQTYYLPSKARCHNFYILGAEFLTYKTQQNISRTLFLEDIKPIMFSVITDMCQAISELTVKISRI